MATKRALRAMAAARRAAEREIEQWDGIMTAGDLMPAKRDIANRIASRVIAAHQREMAKGDRSHGR